MGSRRIIFFSALLLAAMLAACRGASTVPAGADPTQAAPATTSPPTDAPPTAAPVEPTPTSTAPTPSHEVAVYATVVRQLYTVDHTFGDNPPNWPHLYIISSTDDTIAGTGEADVQSRVLTEDVQQAIAAELADLPAEEIIWVETWDDVPVDETNGAIDGGEGVIITLGNIHEQEDGSVHVPASLHCGGLCATGMTYVLEQTDSGWQVTGTTGPAWISQNSASHVAQGALTAPDG